MSNLALSTRQIMNKMGFQTEEEYILWIIEFDGSKSAVYKEIKSKMPRWWRYSLDAFRRYCRKNKIYKGETNLEEKEYARRVKDKMRLVIEQTLEPEPEDFDEESDL